MNKPKVISLDENVYQRVFDAILEQRLPPGTRLNEAELAHIFDVSRTVIRKALVRLAHDGVVETRKNRGTRIASVSRQEAREVFEARGLVEVAIVKLAAGRINDKDAADLRALVDEESSAEAAGDHGKALRLSGEFHFKIAEIAANPLMTSFARNLVSRVSLIIAQFESPGAARCDLQGEHMALVDALQAGDEDIAGALMLEHIQHIEQKIDFGDKAAAQSLRAIFTG